MATKASAPGRSPFQRVIDALEAFYGRPKPPAVTDPFEQVLWENVAYLASDDRRAQAWKRFKTEVGTKPAQILKAARSKLASIGKAGIVPSITADKLRKIAEIAVEEFDGDLKPVLKLPLGDASPSRRTPRPPPCRRPRPASRRSGPRAAPPGSPRHPDRANSMVIFMP